MKIIEHALRAKMVILTSLLDKSCQVTFGTVLKDKVKILTILSRPEQLDDERVIHFEK